jgi:hypothetical protein
MKQYVRVIVTLSATVATGCLCVAYLMPASPLSDDAPAPQFSAARAMRHVGAISQRPHPVGSPELGIVRDYIVAQLRNIWLEPSTQHAFATRQTQADVLLAGEITNVLTRLAGTESNEAILLMAHYDTVSTSPGAVDNASGVAVLLETMRALKSGAPLKHDVIALFTDGEEAALLGAQAFVEDHPWRADVKVAMNMGLLYRGPPVIWSMNAKNGWLIVEWAKSVHGSASASLLFSAFMVGDTDLTPFLKAGVTGAHFLTASSFPYYHTAQDRPENMDAASIQQIGSQVLQFVRYLGDSSLVDTKAPDRVYFPILGKTLHYPLSWVVPLTVAAFVLYSVVLLAGRRKGVLRLTGIAVGLSGTLIGIVVSAGTMVLLFCGVCRIHPEYSLDSHALIKLWQPHLRNGVFYLGAFMLLTSSIVSTVAVMLHRRSTVKEWTMGVLLLWLIGAIALTQIHPGSAYVFHWPLLLGLAGLGLTSATCSRPDDAMRWGGWCLLVSAATSALLLWIPFIYMFYMWTAFVLLAVIAGLTALVLAIVLAPLELDRLHPRWLISVMLLVTGIGLLLAGHFVAYSERPIRYAHAVGYWLDGDSRKAHWVTCPGELDARQTSLFAGSPQVSYPDIFPLAPAKAVLASAAPVAELHGPELSVGEDRYEDGNRTLSLHLAPFHQERLAIHLNPEPKRLVVRDSENKEWAKTFSLVADHRWAHLRFDSSPPSGLDLEMDIPSDEPVEIRLVGVSTGLPSFPGIVTQPCGFMIGPPDHGLGIPTDFTAVHRRMLLPVVRGAND